MKKFLLILTTVLSFWSSQMSAQLVITAETISTCEVSTIDFNVTATGFDDMVSAQFDVIWDPTILSFNGATNNLGMGTASFNNSNPGELGYSWISFVPYTATDPVIFTISFNVLGGYGDNTVVDLGALPGQIVQFANSSGLILPSGYSLVDGSVTIEDSEDPVISGCPMGFTEVIPFGSMAGTVNWTPPTASDNCMLASFTSNDSPPTNLPVGDSTIVYTAVDAAGNNNTCSFTISVVEGPDPNALSFTATGDTLSCGDTQFSVPITTENFDLLTSLGFAMLWDETLIDLTGYTDSINTNGHPQAIYNDTGAPNGEFRFSWIDTNGSPGETLDDGETLFVLHFNWVNTSATDATISFGELPSSVPPFLISASNIGGLINTASINFEDAQAGLVPNQAPVIHNCPPTLPASHPNDPGNCSAVVTWTLPTVTDDCDMPAPALVQTSTLGSGDPFSVGTTTVTYTATDSQGEMTTCSFDITVIDNEAPTAVCQPATAQLDGTGNAMIVAADVDGGSTDNCGIATMTVVPSSFTCTNLGANTVTLTMTDVNGLTDNCTASVTVEDNMAPNAVCQDQTVQLDASGNASVSAGDIDNGSTDNCGGVPSLSVTPNIFGCSGVGANTVTLTVTDASGNSNTCDATVTVEDNISPIATCQDITAQLDANGMASITPTDVDNGSSDNCGFTLSIDVVNFVCANVGANTVTLTVEDATGNMATCTSTVTVEDNVAPDAVCQDITAQLDGAGAVNISPPNVDGGSTDNCGIASVGLDVSSFDCDDIGPNTVTLTVTDVNGNVATCTATVTVEDNVDPIAVCQDITIQLDGTGNVSITPADVDNGSSDNCGIASTSLDVSDFNCTNTGANTVTLTVNDVNGNSSTCTSTVTVEDNILPTANCQDITVQLDANGMASITPADIDNGSSDNCGFTLSIDVVNFVCANVGANTVTLTATDNSSNTASCTATVTLEDNLAPNAICQDLTVQLDGTGSVTITTADVDNGSNDNCGVSTLALDVTNFSCANTGANTVTLTVTDVNGNISTCTSTVTVEDVTLPTATCQDVTIQLDANGAASTTAAAVDNGSTDNCPNFTLSLSQSDFDCDDLGANTVTLTVEDASGNTATCDATVTVEDKMVPTITCPGDISATADPDSCNTVVTWADPVADDNCGGFTVDCDFTSGTSLFPVGMTTVTCTVTDVGGNSTSCTFDVTVTDDQLPTLVCPTDTTVTVPIGTVDTVLNGLGLLAFGDNCMVDTVYYSLTGATTDTGSGSVVVSGTAFNLDTTLVTFYVVDESGNIDSCSFDVVVEEEIVLTLTCPASSVVSNDVGLCSASVSGLDAMVDPQMALQSLSWELTGPSSTDSGTDNLPDPYQFDVGITTVTYTATSTTGFDSTCSFTVEVNDTEIPGFSVCPSGSLNLGNTANECGLEFAGGLVPVATDNCPGVSISHNFAVGDILPIGGPTTVTSTATDAAGNISICTYQVTVSDNQPPFISPVDCPDNQTLPTDAGMCGAVATWPEPTATDNCGVIAFTPSHTSGSFFPAETTEVEYVAVDAAGNVTKCAFSIKVNDVEPPTLSPDCPDNMVVPNDLNECSAVVTWDAPSPSDNCGVVSFIASGIPAGNSFAVGGPHTIAYSATDAAGLTTVCSFTITVDDTQFPTIQNMPQNITIPAALNECGAVVNWMTPTANDNCGIQSFMGGADPGTYFDVTQPGQPHVVEYTAVDVNGNITIEVFEINVVDDQPPTVDCPNDVTVNLDGTISPSGIITGFQPVDCDNAMLDFIVFPTSDNCGPAPIQQTFGLPSGSVFPVGTNTLSFDVSDVNGNVTVCSFNIFVEGLPPAEAIAFPDNPCEGADVLFNVANEIPGANYTWKDPSGVLVASDPSFTLVGIPSNLTGTYSVDVDLGFCQQSATVDVEVFANPEVSIVHNDLLCTDGQVPLDLVATDDANAGVVTWTWEPVNGPPGFGPTFQVPGATSNDAGVYTVIAETGNGCMDTASVDVPISDEPMMPGLSATLPALCAGEQVTLNGQQFTGGTVEYHWSADPMAGSGMPANPASNPSISVEPTQAGTYTYFYAATVDGCISDQNEVVVEVESAPVISLTIDGSTDCLDGTADVTLTATTDVTVTSYEWQGAPGTSTFVISNAQADDSGLYTVTASTSLGCSSTADIPVDITEEPELPTVTPELAELCFGAGTNINSFPSYPAGATYIWTENGVPVNISEPTISVTPDQLGTTSYTLQVEVDGCISDTGFAEILTEQLEDVVIEVDGEVNCLDGTTSVTLLAVSAGATTWDWDGLSTDQTLVIANATAVNSGTYSVTTANGIGCESTGVYQLAITDALPSVEAILENPACEDSELSFCAEPVIPGAIYQWTGPAGNVISDLRCPIIPNATDALNGDYQVTASLDGCESTSEPLPVSVLMPPTANNEVVVGLVNQPQSFDVIVNDEIEGDFTISVVQDAEFGTVTNDGGGVFTYRPQNGFRETDRMAYEICYEDCPQACDIAIVTLLIRFPGDQCVITSVITPNNDGINDELVVSCLEVLDFPQNSMKVFNEWGDEVYSASPYKNDWRGTYNGKDLPDGTYFYIFRKDNSSPAEKGFVQIHR